MAETAPAPGTETITEIKASPRRPDAFVIKVGRKAVATVAARHVADLQLCVGLPWTDALAAQVTQAATIDKAMRAALNRLGSRALSRRDLDEKLRKLEYDAPVRQAVLDRMEQLGYIDDAAYARALAEELLRRKAAGPKLLKQKLWQKGVAGKLADRVIEEVCPPEDEASQAEPALQLAQKKLRTLGRYDLPTRKRRIYSLLARRGFDHNVIDAVMAQLTWE